MKKNIYKTVVLLFAVLLFNSESKAQYDPLFTQYMWNEMYINPAYAGTRDAISLTGLLRNQWIRIDGAPVTQTFSGHAPLFDQHVGVGLNLMHETIGVSDQIYGSAVFAYRFQINEKGKLSFGISGGILNNREALSRVNPDQANDAVFTRGDVSFVLPNAGFGVYYYTDRFYAGLSVPRMIDNQINETGNWEVKNTINYKSIHYFITMGYVFNYYKPIKFKPSIMIKNVYGAPLQMDVSALIFLKDRINIGAAWRTGDAISFLIGVQINPNLRVGYSYDYSVSKLNKFNDGSHEIGIGYDFNVSRKKIVSPRYF